MNVDGSEAVNNNMPQPAVQNEQIPSSELSASRTSASETSVTASDVSDTVTRPLYTVKFQLKEGEFMHDAREDDPDLKHFAKKMSDSSVPRMFYEYSDIISNDQSRDSSSFRNNLNCNRYIDIPCFEELRVQLKAFGENDYIHANYLDGFRKLKKYINAQTPVPSMVEKFWEMIWQEKAVVVISMHSLDNPHFPITSGEEKTYGAITLVHQGTRNVRQAYDATVLNMKKGTESRRILHFEYFDWPQRSTPRRPSEVLHLLADVRHNFQLMRLCAENAGWLAPQENSPLVVVCQTGVGRSSSFIALDIFCEKMDATLGAGRCLINVADTVKRMRWQRAFAVQKPEQFVFLLLAALEYAIRRRYMEADVVSKIHLSNFYLFFEDKQDGNASA